MSTRRLLCAGLIAMLGITVVPASAPDAEAATSSLGGVASLKQVLVSDAEANAAEDRLIAQQFNISVTELQARTRYSDQFSELAEKLHRQFPMQYAYASGQGPAGGPTILGFKGTVPLEVSTLVKSLPYPVQLLDNYPLSLDERDRVAEVALQSLWGAIRTETGGASLDPKSTSITLTYSGGNAEPTEELADKISREISQNINYSGKFAVKFKKFDSPVYVPEVLSGGTRLTRPSDGEVDCTSAFAVRNTTGGTGLLTASHCDDNLRYEGRTNHQFYMAGHLDSSAVDAQWHRSDESVWNQFVNLKVNGTQYLKNVTSTGVAQETNEVCKYGWFSNQGCSTVLKLTHTITNDLGVTYRVSVVNTYFTQGGDSGGPYWKDNSARGVHSGRCTLEDGVARSCFSRIDRVQNNSNLRVITS